MDGPFIGTFMLLMVLATSAWAYADAANLMKDIPDEDRRAISELAPSPLVWLLGCLLLWLFVFPYYLATRGKYIAYHPGGHRGGDGPPKRCPGCFKFYEGNPNFCPICGKDLRP